MSVVPKFDLGAEPTQADVEVVTSLLGHKPRGQFSVVVRNADGSPVVIKNAPLMFDGTPMPTLYWLAGSDQVKEIGHIESLGGVNEAEAEIGEDAIAPIHDRYAAERDALMPADWEGPRPSGGVGGTRIGVKCLHAHYAYLLSGAQDPVGGWIVKRLRAAAGH